MKRIRELRQERGLSAAAMCYETKVHPSVLSVLERRKAVAGERARGAVIALLLLRKNGYRMSFTVLNPGSWRWN